MSAWDIIYTYRLDFLKGLEVTMRLCVIVWSIGILAGAILGVAGARWQILVGFPSRFLSFVLSGVPILVFLFWLYYPLQYALRVDIKPFNTAAAALSIVNTFLVADLIRGVLLEFPDQYLSAARVCGLTSGETVLRNPVAHYRPTGHPQFALHPSGNASSHPVCQPDLGGGDLPRRPADQLRSVPAHPDLHRACLLLPGHLSASARAGQLPEKEVHTRPVGALATEVPWC